MAFSIIRVLTCVVSCILIIRLESARAWLTIELTSTSPSSSSTTGSTSRMPASQPMFAFNTPRMLSTISLPTQACAAGISAAIGVSPKLNKALCLLASQTNLKALDALRSALIKFLILKCPFAFSACCFPAFGYGVGLWSPFILVPCHAFD